MVLRGQLPALSDQAYRRQEKNCTPYPPPNLHEYQNKGLTKFAFRNSLILKDAFLAVWTRTS